MAQFTPTDTSYPLEDQLKSLADDELLDFWEETQHLAGLLAAEMRLAEGSHLEYEQLIVRELSYRSCLRLAGRR